MIHASLLHRLLPGFVLIVLSVPAQAQGFFGTTTLLPFEIAVNNERVVRLEPGSATEGPNVILGWSGNTVAQGVEGATIGGGGDPDFLGSPFPNQVMADHGTVSGGLGNTASGINATVGGGIGNTASGNVDTVSGGNGNTANGSVDTVSGGLNNTASGYAATVGGGTTNTANGTNATVGGGSTNTASGASATVGGGYNHTASGDYATVSGGFNNTASDDYATVSGGYDNHARGAYSFAAGYYARAAHDGTFVWSDNSQPYSDSLVSTAEDQFLIRATVGVGTNNPQAQLHLLLNSTGTTPHLLLEEDNTTDYARLRLKNTSNTQYWDVAAGTAGTDRLNFFTSGGRGDVMSLRATGDPLIMYNGAKLTEGGTWMNASSRQLKTDFEAVDGADVLERLAALSIQTWRYKAEASARHLGPTAEDFYAAFSLGDTSEGIATVDADGVALAAIQAMYAQNRAQQTELAELRAVVEALQAQQEAMVKELVALREASAIEMNTAKDAEH